MLVLGCESPHSRFAPLALPIELAFCPGAD
jgi:hypothetical protein